MCPRSVQNGLRTLEALGEIKPVGTGGGAGRTTRYIVSVLSPEFESATWQKVDQSQIRIAKKGAEIAGLSSPNNPANISQMGADSDDYPAEAAPKLIEQKIKPEAGLTYQELWQAMEVRYSSINPNAVELRVGRLRAVAKEMTRLVVEAPSDFLAEQVKRDDGDCLLGILKLIDPKMREFEIWVGNKVWRIA